VYVVTDFYTVNRPDDRDRHDPEIKALVAKRKAREASE
jgi:hypothetical protein